MSTGVVLPYWPDRPALEALDVADAAERNGVSELWVGEMATFDAFALATAIGSRHRRLQLTIGPLAVGVRDPAMLALGVASVAALTDRPPHLALGASTPVVVEGWHGRPWRNTADHLRETVLALRPLLAGDKSTFEGRHASSRGFRLRVDAPASSITVAAFGERTIALAGELADRMVVNLVTTAQASVVRDKLERAAKRVGRTPPPLAAWVTAAVDPDDKTLEQVKRALVAYVGAPAYGEMFADAGFGEVVARARGGGHPRDVLAAIPRELLEAVGAIGDAATVRRRIGEYRRAGVDHVAVVPATAGDPAGGRTLGAL